MDRVNACLETDMPPGHEDVTRAFWFACHGGQRDAAAFLLARGADVNWIPTWERVTPLDAARRSGAEELVTWLVGKGARSAKEN
jgi:hypothetical protein